MQKLTLAAFYLVSIIAAFLIGERTASTHIAPTAMVQEVKGTSLQPLRELDNISASIETAGSLKNATVKSIAGAQELEQVVSVQEEPKSQLQGKVARLQRQFEELSSQYQKKISQLDEAHRVLQEAGLGIPNAITLEEVQKYVAAPFDQQIVNSPNFVTDKFKSLHEAEEDFAWGVDMQTRIHDFIITHEHGLGVQVQSIICKNGGCEIRGFAMDSLDKWEEILKDISEQAWWQFTSTSSMSGNRGKMINDELRPWFYLISTGGKAN